MRTGLIVVQNSHAPGLKAMFEKYDREVDEMMSNKMFYNHVGDDDKVLLAERSYKFCCLTNKYVGIAYKFCIRHSNLFMRQR